ncbi:MAG: thiamine pyrophosphate-binding protein [Chloroflexi bacterium]|nr:thiamine pyrophosphate-binding protein [Chloroflexota bacterium]
MVINSQDAARAISQRRGEALVVATMSALRLWTTISERPELDVPLTGCMGKASSLGLGLALAAPDRQVLVLDGDGSLLMNLGTLVTIANKAPTNLAHFVFDDGAYTSIGDIPVPGGEKANLAAMAKAAGYPAVYDFDNLEELATTLDEVLSVRGPVFIRLKVRHIGPMPPLPGIGRLKELLHRLPSTLAASPGRSLRSRPS